MQMALKQLFFPEKLQKSTSAGGFYSQMPVCDTLEFHQAAQHPFNYLL